MTEAELVAIRGRVTTDDSPSPTSYYREPDEEQLHDDRRRLLAEVDARGKEIARLDRALWERIVG